MQKEESSIAIILNLINNLLPKCFFLCSYLGSCYDNNCWVDSDQSQLNSVYIRQRERDPSSRPLTCSLQVLTSYHTSHPAAVLSEAANTESFSPNLTSLQLLHCCITPVHPSQSKQAHISTFPPPVRRLQCECMLSENL